MVPCLSSSPYSTFKQKVIRPFSLYYLITYITSFSFPLCTAFHVFPCYYFFFLLCVPNKRSFDHFHRTDTLAISLLLYVIDNYMYITTQYQKYDNISLDIHERPSREAKYVTRVRTKTLFIRHQGRYTILRIHVTVT